MIRRMFLVVLLAAMPLTAQQIPGARAWRVTLAVHAGSDSAAVAKRLAATYRGHLETPVDESGTFLISLTDASAEMLASDAAVRTVQPESVSAVASPVITAGVVRTPQIVANGGSEWRLGDYSYDGAGNVRKIDRDGATLNADQDTYVYDVNNRLTSGTAGGKTERYTYDEFGNILSIETTGTSRQTLGVNAASNRMDQTTGVFANQSVTFDMTAGYDANGNVTSYRLDRFEYDGLNVLRRAHVAGRWRSYVYTPADERLAVIEQTSQFGGETRSDWTFRDASGQVLRRLSREAGQWQWNQDYIYRDGQMLASDVAGPAKRYHYHLDHLGTPRLITGNGGVEISRLTYLPYGTEVGAPAGQDPADGEWKKFTGHERDEGSIDYMHARYYNPFLGRFLSVDPAANWAKAISSPQAWNRYSYARNNPLRLVDPDGRDDKDFRVLTARINVVYSNVDVRIPDRGNRTLRQITEQGIAYASKFYAKAGIKLEVHRSEATINTQAGLANLNGPVRTPAGEVGLSDFMRSQPRGTLNVLVSSDLVFTGRTVGIGGPTAIGNRSDSRTFNDEISHALGNVTTVKLPGSNWLADTRLDVQEMLVDHGYDLGDWYKDTFRETLEHLNGEHQQ